MKLFKQLDQLISSSGSCALGVVANLGIVALTLPFVTVPSGNSIRPMGWAFLIGMIALGTFVVGIITALIDVFSGKCKFGLVGFFLCLVPFPLASLLLHLLALIKGFHLSE